MKKVCSLNMIAVCRRIDNSLFTWPDESKYIISFSTNANAILAYICNPHRQENDGQEKR